MGQIKIYSYIDMTQQDCRKPEANRRSSEHPRDKIGFSQAHFYETGS